MIDFDIDINNCIATLKQGGIILYPTDTIWGIGCDATNETAVQKIFSIKKRKESKALIVLVSSKQEVLQYTANKDLNVFEYLDTAQKPTTVIYDHAIHLAKNLLADDGSVGIRICKDAFCKSIIKGLGKPIVSTSANISGSVPPHFFKEIEEAIKLQMDYIVQYRQEDEKPKEPSAIIRWKNGTVEIIRA